MVNAHMSLGACRQPPERVLANLGRPRRERAPPRPLRPKHSGEADVSSGRGGAASAAVGLVSASGAGVAGRAGGGAMLGGATQVTPGCGWPWALAAVVVALCVGSGLGALVLGRNIRSKYGGLRIY